MLLTLYEVALKETNSHQFLPLRCLFGELSNCSYLAILSSDAILAQLVEHLIRNERVTCSIHVDGLLVLKVNIS